MIFVTGGTGTVGSALLSKLRQRGARVRALAHSADGRAMIERAQGEAVPGDLDRPESLQTAMAGCDRMFLLSRAHLDQPAREIAAIDAARRAGVKHVVALSIMGADANSTAVFARWHAEIDDHLVRSGLDYTILRPAGFMQTHLWPVRTVRSQGRWFGMSGDGAAGFIDADDVAAVAAEVLTSPGHEGSLYELTGPAATSMPEAAAVLSDVIGRPVTYVDLPAEEFRARLTGGGIPDFVADAVVNLYQVIRAGHAATVTNSVQEVLGRPARSYREFAETHKTAFRTM